MAQDVNQAGELRYLNPVSVDVKKKKYAVLRSSALSM